ncbi:hypothetical protein [Segatella salivae]|uniref:hypothetical protein n=1 Tax=Segatella salivae TaxID=228604 RepID=UPI0028DC363B|nr:hypothetical protein [Segatella salivae]
MHGYSEVTHGGLRLESATTTALVHANHTLLQGSLHNRLATLGHLNYGTHGVIPFCTRWVS